MRANNPSLRDQLEETVASYRHVREEHRRARPDGRTHRQHESRLEELGAHFERLLAGAELQESVREQWRRHLYDGAAEPEAPAEEAAAPEQPRRPPKERSRGSAPLWQR
jgi:hypothetical protein